MSALLKEVVVVGLALLAALGAVEVLRDRAVLVPPPEMVVEEFVRDLSLERWEPAGTHLAQSVAQRVGPDSLRAYRDAVERRVGRIEEVRGEPFFATDVAAEATAEITTDAAAGASIRLPLVWERGGWRITRLDLES
jgi:hypothetical protein